MLIKANPRKALRYYSPFFSVAALLLAFGIYLRSTPDMECDKLFGVYTSYLSILLYTYVLPLIFLSVSLWFAWKEYKIVKFKYNPPLDIPVFRDKVAEAHNKITLRNIVTLSYPAAGLLVVALGHVAYTDLVKEKTPTEVLKLFDDKCKPGL